jgi:DNA-binding Xre family transcriptional regulator
LLTTYFIKVNNKFKLVNIDNRIILKTHEFSLMKEKYLEHYRTIGKNVRDLRLMKGWTQADLANRCSINAEQVSRIENARRDYMHSTLLEVCDALDVSVIDIMSKHNK